MQTIPDIHKRLREIAVLLSEDNLSDEEEILLINEERDLHCALEELNQYNY